MEENNNLKIVPQDNPDYSRSKIHKLLINYFMAVRDKTFQAHKDKEADKVADIILETTANYTDLIEAEIKSRQAN